VDCIAVNDCDTSGMRDLEQLIRDMRRRGEKGEGGHAVLVVFVRLREELEAFVVRAFEEEGFGEKGEVGGWFCKGLEEGMDVVRRRRQLESSSSINSAAGNAE